MGRYINDIDSKKSEADLNKLIQDFMSKEGFKQFKYGQEQVWKKGMGILTGPQFMKTDAKAGKVHLEAWIKMALLPGVYVGEMGITGFFAFAIKAVLKKRVENLQKLIAG
ncbi:MAG: hypothetical protein EHM28_12175 [Spirochaetaceae bacterium]|nr:MAG: hypothetical protein EHM28_12175 [Spirochaetaceae bacterium]